MLIKSEDNKYVILDDYSRFPESLEKEAVDKAVADIKKAVDVIRDTVYALYENDTEIYRLLEREVFDGSGLECDDGWITRFEVLCNRLEEFKATLTRNDNIPELTDIINLEDLGFQPYAPGEVKLWQKITEDSREKEVAEEIVMDLDGDKDVHRTRTIYWAYMPGVRSSTKIEYSGDLPMDEMLTSAVANTKRELGGKP